MARPLEKIKNLSDSKSTWKIGVRVVDLWTVSNSKNRQHLEMVLCDKEGDTIQVIIPNEFKDQFKSRVAENETFILQNFEVEKNEMTIKATDHKFRLVFNGGTIIEDVNKHKIPKPMFKFKDFADIKAGNVRPDVLIDVIGAFHELGYTQTVAGSRKIQISFWMKDLKGNLLSCTLWEDFGLKFLDYTKGKMDFGPTIIMLHNAKIKEATDKYELGVSNAWNATKLFINANLPEINEFKKGLCVDEASSSQSTQLSLGSQIMSQSSSMTQYSTIDKFIGAAVVLPLSEIIKLRETTTCVTVVKMKKVKPTKNGWYYKACSKCPRAAKGDTLPLLCSERHETNAINLRFKLDMEVEFNHITSKFVFWDRECNELLGTTAADLQRIMTEAGVTNPLEYPMKLDELSEREVVCRVKWQPTWDSCSVQAIKMDDSFVEKIKEVFPKEQDASLLAIEGPNLAEDVDVLPKASDEVDLSKTCENDCESLASLTPGKRVAVDDVEKDASSPNVAPTQLSSTKLKKHIKVEKKD